jgi:hypothetical protein
VSSRSSQGDSGDGFCSTTIVAASDGLAEKRPMNSGAFVGIFKNAVSGQGLA